MVRRRAERRAHGDIVRGAERVFRNHPADEIGRQRAERRIGEVVGEGDAAEADLGREGVDHHEGHDADRADREAGESIKRNDEIWPRLRSGIKRIGACDEGERHDRHHRLQAEAVETPAGEDRRKGQRSGGHQIGERHICRRDAEELWNIRGGEKDQHHDGGGEHPAGDDRDDHAPPMAGQRLHQRDAARGFGAGADGLENRGFLQEAAQIHRDEAEDAADDEGNAPGPIEHDLRREAAIDDEGHQRAEQDAEREAAGEHAAGEADAAGRDMFRYEDPGPRRFAADRRALRDAEEQQQDRRGVADGREGRHEADQQRRHRHEEDREHEHALAADEIAEMRHDDAAERPRDIARREDAVALKELEPFGRVGREEQLADDGGEEHEDDEVVEFQRAAQRGERQGPHIAPVQRARFGLHKFVPPGTGAFRPPLFVRRYSFVSFGEARRAT